MCAGVKKNFCQEYSQNKMYVLLYGRGWLHDSFQN